MYLHKHITANNVTLEKFPFQREVAMEAYLIENPVVLSIESFDEVEILNSEVSLLDAGVKKDTDGRIDIFAKYGQDCLAVVELKSGKLNQDHLDQLKNYLEKKSQIIEKFPDIWDPTVSKNPKWIGVMVGKTIDPDLMLQISKGCYVCDDIPIVALTLNRYRDKDGNIYVITDSYLPEKFKNMDYTKYSFNGQNQNYGKAKLVLAVMKDFAEKKPEITFIELSQKFPKSLLGSEPFTTEAKAKYKRHYIKPDELIALKDGKIAVSTQWGIGNIDKFIKVAESLDYKISRS